MLLTCEHASNRLPEPWVWSEADSRLREMHWAIDHGAAELTRELAAAMQTTAVLARFTRLLIDPNRALSSPTLFRARCDGDPVELNQGLSEVQRRQRVSDYYEPYHSALAAQAARLRPRLVFSVHSFTPVYEGQLRSVRLGVLYDRDRGPAEWLAERLQRGMGFDVALNAPWSGANGLMYAAHSHADRHQALALELEARQDLLVDPAFRAELVPVLSASLQELVA